MPDVPWPTYLTQLAITVSFQFFKGNSILKYKIVWHSVCRNDKSWILLVLLQRKGMLQHMVYLEEEELYFIKLLLPLVFGCNN